MPVPSGGNTRTWPHSPRAFERVAEDDRHVARFSGPDLGEDAFLFLFLLVGRHVGVEQAHADVEQLVLRHLARRLLRRHALDRALLLDHAAAEQRRRRDERRNCQHGASNVQIVGSLRALLVLPILFPQPLPEFRVRFLHRRLAQLPGDDVVVAPVRNVRRNRGRPGTALDAAAVAAAARRGPRLSGRGLASTARRASLNLLRPSRPGRFRRCPFRIRRLTDRQGRRRYCRPRPPHPIRSLHPHRMRSRAMRAPAMRLPAPCACARRTPRRSRRSADRSVRGDPRWWPDRRQGRLVARHPGRHCRPRPGRPRQPCLQCRQILSRPGFPPQFQPRRTLARLPVPAVPAVPDLPAVPVAPVAPAAGPPPELVPALPPERAPAPPPGCPPDGCWPGLPPLAVLPPPDSLPLGEPVLDGLPLDELVPLLPPLFCGCCGNGDSLPPLDWLVLGLVLAPGRGRRGSGRRRARRLRQRGRLRHRRTLRRGAHRATRQAQRTGDGPDESISDNQPHASGLLGCAPPQVGRARTPLNPFDQREAQVVHY